MVSVNPTLEQAGSVGAKDAYWDKYYGQQMELSRPLPSQFAAFVAGELAGPRRVVEFGCGNGRDSLFLSSYGHDVVGVDASAAAVERCRALATALGESATFVQAHIEDTDLVGRIPATTGPTAIYARFFLHAITEAEEAAFFAASAGLTRSGDLMAVEYRTIRDRSNIKVTGAHYRRFMDPHDFHLRSADSGFRVNYAVEGFGFAKYREDDAYVARCLLTRD